ncbi:hypothetical protein C8F04DRAFT_1174890 [Mycena alexandri]|uniref:Uncharacterized protein n=1 Tax=Mycena alexandri TaxID=1745969 RepID=A0AAD6TFK5_9AGAR|nr:hypothetical protein C8F04DRAFT_1174890 [Mycena alexandri]
MFFNLVGLARSHKSSSNQVVYPKLEETSQSEQRPQLPQQAATLRGSAASIRTDRSVAGVIPLFGNHQAEQQRIYLTAFTSIIGLHLPEIHEKTGVNNPSFMAWLGLKILKPEAQARLSQHFGLAWLPKPWLGTTGFWLQAQACTSLTQTSGSEPPPFTPITTNLLGFEFERTLVALGDLLSFGSRAVFARANHTRACECYFCTNEPS